MSTSSTTGNGFMCIPLTSWLYGWSLRFRSAADPQRTCFFDEGDVIEHSANDSSRA